MNGVLLGAGRLPSLLSCVAADPPRAEPRRSQALRHLRQPAASAGDPEPDTQCDGSGPCAVRTGDGRERGGTRRGGGSRWMTIGPGIPPEILPRIFEPFFTTKARRDGPRSGGGPSDRRGARRVGHLHLASRQGTTFRIWLPAATTRGGARPLPSAPARPGGARRRAANVGAERFPPPARAASARITPAGLSSRISSACAPARIG